MELLQRVFSFDVIMHSVMLEEKEIICIPSRELKGDLLTEELVLESFQFRHSHNRRGSFLRLPVRTVFGCILEAVIHSFCIYFLCFIYT